MFRVSCDETSSICTRFGIVSILTISCMFFLVAFIRWDPKKRMTPDEACRHEWLQPNSTSTTFIITSTSTSSLTKHSRDQVKENDHDYAPILQKLQRSQPITPLTILPQIKTPSNHASHNYNNTKDSNKIKGEYILYASDEVENDLLS